MQRSFFPHILKGMLWMSLLLLISVGCSSPSSSALTPFSADGTGYNGGQWSPNGYWFAASKYDGDIGNLQLFSSQGQLVSSWQSGCYISGDGRAFSWLLDGQLSCFVGNAPPLLKLMEFDQQGHVKKNTQITVPLTSGTAVYDFQWNPRHFWLATIAESQPGNGLRTLYVSNFEEHNLMQPMQINADQVVWSPDGTMLALTQPNGDIVLLNVHQAPNGMLLVTPLRQLAAGASDIGNLSWSPSGRWLVCRHASYNSEDYLFLYATDGSGRMVKLTSSTTDGQLDNPAWSPDGKQLVVAQIAMSGNVLMKLDMVSLLKEKGVTP